LLNYLAQWFKNLSIKNKLRLLIVLTSAVVLIPSTALLIWDEIKTLKIQMENELLILVNVISHDITVTQTLGGSQFSSLVKPIFPQHLYQRYPHMRHIYIVSVSGDILMRYTRSDIEYEHKLVFQHINNFYIINNKQRPNPSFIRFHNNHVDIISPVFNGDKLFGLIYLQADSHSLKQQINHALFLVSSTFILAMLLAYWIAALLQTPFTRSFYQLLTAMQLVSQEQNYTLRLENLQDKELNNLASTFNTMLSQIEKRDSILNSYREHLTERVKIRTAELSKAKEKAEMAKRTKDTFLNNISHELRNPLNAILGFGQILREENNLNQVQCEQLELIRGNAEYLLTLIGDILDLAQLEAGQVNIYPKEMQLLVLLNQVAGFFRLRARQKNLVFYLEYLNDLPPKIYADEKRLHQILVNLLSNAIKFTEVGCIRLQVAYQSDQLNIKISDSGIGIDEADKIKIFQAFQQVEQHNKLTKGAGLGLAITYALVKHMNGFIEVFSEDQEGTTFSIKLPIQIIDKQIHHIDNNSIDKIIGFKGTPQRVLIVDDKKINHETLHSILKPLGFIIDDAENGQIALEKVNLYQPDLVLMDLIMPILDGLSTCEQLRKDYSKTELPLIALSTNTFSEQQQAAENIGFNDLIAKPIDKHSLLPVLAKVLKLDWIYAA